MLGKPKDAQGISKPRWTQLYVWQVPIMLLNIGLILFLAGLVAAIFNHVESPLSPVDVKVGSNLFLFYSLLSLVTNTELIEV